MISIPEEIAFKPSHIIPLKQLQEEYNSAYNKSISVTTISLIDEVSLIAGFYRKKHDDNRFNAITFITVKMKNFANTKELLEIAKAIFRTIRTQCFLIFQYNDYIEYSASLFWANKINNSNNTVKELVISEKIYNNIRNNDLLKAEEKIQNAISSQGDPKEIYTLIYNTLMDIKSYVMKWKDKSNWIDDIISSESAENGTENEVPLDDCTYTFKDDLENEIQRENMEYDAEEPTEEKKSPEFEKQQKEYLKLKENAENDMTGESQYLFAKKHYYGTLHRNLITYRDFLIKAAQKGYPTAIEELAPLYETGMKDDRDQILIKRDLKEAISLYRKVNNGRKIIDLMIQLHEVH